MNLYAMRLRKPWIGFLLAAVIVAQFGWTGPRANVAEAADNGLAQKPYMGWSSYSLQVYDGPSGNWTSEAKIKQMSDAMHEKLQSHGYNYINIDAGWNGSMDEYGRPVPSTTLYPGGFENLANYVHNNGQKIGIYLIPGISPTAVEENLPIYDAPGCTIGDIAVKPYTTADYWNLGYKIDFSNPCAQKYVDSVADEIASWGVDFVKFDSVTPGSGHNDTSIDARDDVKAWSEALSRHHIWFEISWALDHNYVDFWKKYANGWRVDWDVESYNPAVGMTQWSNVARLFPDAELWWRDAGPGGWNDFDSLDIGNGATSGLTKDERQTAMTLWAASSAQLYIGDDIANLDDYGLSLLTNDDVIAVNQAGHPIHPVSTASDQQAWYANNGDGTYTVALFNLGSKGAKVGVNWSDIGLSGSASIRDLWSHQELGSSDAGIQSVYLEPHASRLFKVTAQGGSSIVNDDDTGMKYEGAWTRNGGNELVRDAQDLSVIVTDPVVTASEGPAGTGDGANGSPDGGAPAATEAAASHTVMINDNDPAIQYQNQWGYSNNRSFNDYQGDVHYGEPNGGTQPEMSYEFNGTGIEVWAEKSSSSGKLDVYVDGELKETVDTQDAVQAGQAVAYTVSGLAQGPHTLRVVRNDGGEHYFLFDALKVTADTLLGAPSSAGFNKDAPADITVPLPFGAGSLSGIKQGGTALQAGTDYTASGNTATIKAAYLAQQPSGQPAQLTFSFAGGDAQSLSIAVSGTSISPTAAQFDKRPTAQRDIDVTLALPDGNSLTAVKNGADTLTAGEDYAVDGSTVRILKAYLASQPVGDTSLTFEFAQSTPRTLVVSVSNSASPGRYAMINNNDPSIRYTGGWSGSGGRNLGDYKDDVQWTEGEGAFFTYTFQGTGIDYITEVDQGQGDVEIFIDGVSQGTVSTYGTDAHNKPQVTVFSATGLTNGFHTLKAVKKTGKFMLLDALRVQLPDLIDVSSTDYEKGASEDVSVNLMFSADSLSGIWNGAAELAEGSDYTIDDRKVTIAKAYLDAQPAGTTKLTFRLKGDYADDIHAATEDGSAYAYAFQGTGVELLAPTSPKQGDMEISIDGELKATVSAHSADRTAQTSLFRSDALADGAHTIRVVKKSGELMLADALKFNVSAGTVTPPVGSGGGIVVTDPSAPQVVRTTQPDGTVKDELALTGDNARALIDKQKAAGQSAVTLSIPDATDAAALASVKLAADAVKQLAESGLDLDIDAANVKLHIPNALLKQADGSLYLDLTPVKSTEQGAQIEGRAKASAVAAVGANGGAAELAGRPVDIATNLPQGEVTLVLPLQAADANGAPGTLGVYIEHSDGTKEFKPGEAASFGGKPGVRFATTKFSTFAPLKLTGAAGAKQPYIQGFDGHLFKPGNTLTRAELATILSRVAPSAGGTAGKAYKDVKPGHWAAAAIAKATAAGLMSGYGDGSFKPEQPVSRAEMAAIAVRLSGSAAKPGPGFTDTAGSWAEQAIRTAQGAGFLQGYEDGSFRPDRTLTRAEAVVVLNRTLGIQPLNAARSSWSDVPSGFWALGDIEAASAGSGGGAQDA
ncbi:X2-like carbohydrate binding domain-containing protein [Paenibacillus artemisiicola]|uniref:X2-like carbohydrate binding domain-containing protein n=1 Tax=Paenibacillus artemisiicola TaxID=1172618 RepID=UPI001F0A926D|nr:X2-like carbohydrate binding domain-containing protein [Paenibacillus artemisiicola]